MCCRQATEIGKERKSKRKRAQEMDSSGSDDEFYDRTKKPAKPSKNNAVLTVKAICTKLQGQEKEVQELQKQLEVRSLGFLKVDIRCAVR